jgi:hypothetical protein
MSCRSGPDPRGGVILADHGGDAHIALATGMTMFHARAAWGTVIEVGRNHVGVVGATMNSVGNIRHANPLMGCAVGWFATGPAAPPSWARCF